MAKSLLMKPGAKRCYIGKIVPNFLCCFLILTVLSKPYFIQAQEEERKWTLNGYVKDLVTLNFVSDSTLVDNLIHNRINFRWFPNDHFTFRVELRNRIFHGDLVKAIPTYSDFIDVNDDYFDLSAIIVDEKSLVIHTMIDRAYLEYTKEDWEIKVGRQRVNWGKNLVWNPNDLFNTYSFFDFDYEERPGSDAVRIKKYTGFASSFEFASNISDDFDQVVMAGMWSVNKGGYDIQFIGGKAQEDITFGAGWAGNIKTAGFKGELTYFVPYKTNANNAALVGSISGDYSFKNSLYLHASVLFNSEGASRPISPLILFTAGKLTARNLSFYRYTTFFQASYALHPLVNTGLASIYYPSDKTLFLNPSVTVSIVTNLDLDLVGQIIYDDNSKNYKASAKLMFVRLKWSF